jgi:glutathione S-transferase
MSFTLYCHPLASYCWKALIALYETETPFTARHIDLGNAAERDELAALWPMTKFPVLRDDARGKTVPEATIIIEYLAQVSPGRTALLPADPEAARETRLRDRIFDLHVHESMQRIVADRIRPADAKDPYGVAAAHATLAKIYPVLEAMFDRPAGAGDQTMPWSMGATFTLADCAAAPALYYANRVHPFGDEHPRLAAYLKRLHARPSFARVFREAEPYLPHFPER